MKILVFTHAAGSPHHGPNWRWYYLGRALSALGHQVSVVGSSWFHKYYTSPTPTEDYSLRDPVNLEGVDFYWLKTNRYKGRLGQLFNQFLYSAKALVLALQFRERERFDVIVVSSPPPFVIFPAKVMAKRLGIPLVFETRDLWPLVVKELSGFSSRNPYIQLISFFERFAVNNASLITSVKPGDVSYFEENYSIAPGKAQYVPNGFLPEEPLASASGGLYEPEAPPFVIGYLGSMNTYCPLDDLLWAARSLSDRGDIEFHLIGDGPDVPRLRGLCEKHGITNVRFLGKIDKSEIGQALAKFHVCFVVLRDIKANLNGISSNKIFEYMSAHKPIIASYKTNYDPVQDSNCGITVRPGVPSDITDAILYLRANPQLRYELGENGYEYFQNNHNFSVVAKKYESLLKQVLY